MFIGQQPQSDILKDYASYVNPGRVDTFHRLGMDFIPGKRDGVWIWDVDGEKRLLNCRCSGGVFNFGHRPEIFVDTLKQALDEVDVGDHMLLSEARASLGKLLAEVTPGDIQFSTFSPGGAEAIEIALKLARGYTRRPGIISVEKGYHGHTGFALATGEDSFRGKFGPMPAGFDKVPFGDIDALAGAISEDTAAVIMETIPATAGMLIPPDDYYVQVRGLCDEHGAQFIVDEVQSGLGRTGRMWAIDEWDVVPDILVTGKGLSGAVYPMSATCHRPHLDSFFRENPFIHLASFGGSELGCIVAQKVIEETAKPEFLAHVRDMAHRFAAGFEQLKARYPIIEGWRQRGLMIGLETVDDRFGPLMAMGLAHNGVVAVFANHRPSTLQIMPPLIIQPDEVDFLLDALDKTCTWAMDPCLASQISLGDVVVQ
jgi:putrescine aminotransferase